MAQQYRLGRCRRRSQLLRGWTKNDLVDIDLGRLLDRVSDGARDRVRRDLLFVELKPQPRVTLCRKSIISDSLGAVSPLETFGVEYFKLLKQS
jgi:hypothetical protein